MDTAGHIVSWVHAVDAFNRSDVDTFGEVLADNCEFSSSAGIVGSGRHAIVGALKSLRSQGWSAHRILSLVGEGEFITGTARNEFVDGSSFVVAGVARFGPDGKITEIRSFEPVEVVARILGTA
jgi:hypothetical protein